MRLKNKFGSIVILFVYSFLSSFAFAATPVALSQEDTVLPQVSEKLGQKIDLNLTFINERGETKKIKDMFDKQEVLVLTLNYFRCTTMCTYQLLNLAENLKNLNWKIGDGYSVATISFDPTDTVDKALNTQKTWTEKLGDKKAPWHFYVGSENNSKKLASQLNFYFEKDNEGNYAHTASLFFIAKDGTLKKYLYGIVYDTSGIRNALIDSSDKKIGTVFDKFLHFFSKYNTSRGRYYSFLGDG